MFNCEIKKMIQRMIPSCLIAWLAYLMKTVKNRPMEKKHTLSLNEVDHENFEASLAKISDIEYTSQNPKEFINSGDTNSSREPMYYR